jgi:hypothetical protein
MAGTFNGRIDKTSGGYRAVGTFTPSPDTYDFNNDHSRGPLANGAAAIGRWEGAAAHIGSLGVIDPKPYTIYFGGGPIEINQSW